jgi:hypothetical protein
MVQGCLNRLDLLGFVRPFVADREQSAEAQVWEVSHDFVARLLSLILPAWKPSLWSRLRRGLGPALMGLGIVAVLVLMPLPEERLQQWAARYGASATLLEDGTFAVHFGGAGKPADFRTAIRADGSEFANLISSLDLRGNGLTSLPPEVSRLTNLTFLNLSNNDLTSLPPEVTRLTNLTDLDLGYNHLTSLPPEVGRLTNLTDLDLRNNPMLKDPPPEVLDRGTKAILEYLRAKLASASNTQESQSGDREPAREP